MGKLATGVLVDWTALEETVTLELATAIDVLRLVDVMIKVDVLRGVENAAAELLEPRTIDSGGGKKLEVL